VRWEAVFAVFLVCHLTGDFLLQTEWQAANKQGGLSRDPTARRALLSHVSIYTVVFLPALIWVSEHTSALAIALLAVVFVPHLVQDDARLLIAWNRIVKKSSPEPGDPLYMAIDQSFHVVFLFATSLLALA
jgi:Protein of unknown function (DUF3307)